MGALDDLLPIRRIKVDGEVQPFVRDIDFDSAAVSVTVDQVTGVAAIGLGDGFPRLESTARTLSPDGETSGAADSEAIAAAIAAMRPTYLVPGATYYLSGDIPEDFGLLRCNGGEARLVAGSAWPGDSITKRGNVVRIVGESNLRPTYSAASNHPARSGVRTGAARSHASTIDSAITDLDYHAAYDNGRAAAVGTYGKLPILVFIHGYNGTWGNITDNPKFRGCDAGFYCITPNLRGRTGSNGTADDSARELYDIDDAIAHAVSTDPTLVDGSRVYIIGYSGGGANAIAYAAKRPGRCVAIVALFGWADYGVSPAAAHSFWGYSTGDRTTIEARIGTRDALDLAPYRARNSLTNIAQSISLGTTKLFLLWDEADTDVGTLSRDVRQALIDGGAPRSRWYAEESTAASAIRWEHGYVDDTPALINAEYVVHQLRDLPAPTAEDFGEIVVCGHMKHPDFEVWTAATGTLNPRTDSTGGQRYSVRLIFNTLSGEYLFEPLEGACKVLVKLADGSEFAKELT